MSIIAGLRSRRESGELERTRASFSPDAVAFTEAAGWIVRKPEAIHMSEKSFMVRSDVKREFAQMAAED